MDVSGVTFLDCLCVRELAVHYQLHAERLALCDPSRQVRLGVAVCDLEDWIGFRSGESSGQILRRVR